MQVRVRGGWKEIENARRRGRWVLDVFWTFSNRPSRNQLKPEPALRPGRAVLPILGWGRKVAVKVRRTRKSISRRDVLWRVTIAVPSYSVSPRRVVGSRRSAADSETPYVRSVKRDAQPHTPRPADRRQSVVCDP